METPSNRLSHSTTSRRTLLKGAAVAGGSAALYGGGFAAAKRSDVLRGLEVMAAPLQTTPDERVITTYCPPNCGGRCVLDCTVRDGRFVKVEPGQHPDPRYTAICVRGLTHPQRVYSPDRIKYPMRRVGERGEGKFERITWGEALDTIAAKLKEARDGYEPGSIVFTGTSGGSSTDYNRLASLLKAGLLNGYMASQGRATGIDIGNVQGMILAYGLSFANFFSGANEWTDRPNARLVIVWGQNPAETSMTSMRYLFDAKGAGTKVVVVDPRYSATAMSADWWVHPRPGTDSALAWGMINVLIDEDLFDRDFVKKHTIGPLLISQKDGSYLRTPLPQEVTSAIPPGMLPVALASTPDLAALYASSVMVWDEAQRKAVPVGSATEPAPEGTFTIEGVQFKTGFQLLKEKAAEYTPEKVEEITGVPAADVRKLGRLYGTLKPSTIGMGFGIDRQWASHTVGRLLGTLGGLTGNVGKPGASVGIASHGFGFRTAALGPERKKPLPKDAVRTKKVGIKPKMIFSQGDFMNQYYADMNWTKELAKGLDFLVTADHFWQTTCLWSDIVLPACTFLESETDLVNILSDRNAVILKRKVIDPLWESKSDAQIERELAERLGWGEYFQDKPEDVIRNQIEGSRDPQMAGITFDQVVAGGARLKGPATPNVQNVELVFTTPTGRIQWYNEEMLPFGEALPVYKDDFEASRNHPLAKKYPLVYTQYHVRQRAHSTYFNSAWTLEIWPEPILEMNPGDAGARGIKNGDYVEAFNDRGRAVARAVLNTDFGPGHCNITEGWKQQQFKAGHFQELTNPASHPAAAALFDLYGMFFAAFAMFGTSNISFGNTRVEVRKVKV